MWHEARKIEKKIRGIMIDYRRRAERRTAYYQKMREDPHQLLRLHGQKCKLYIDSRPDKPSEESQLVPWQGDPNILIDRFDARSQLDYIPDIVPGVSQDSSGSECQMNYERYRTLVQIEATGVTEESYLKQLAIEESYGRKQAEKARLEKEELSKKKASIGYKYEDSSIVSEDSDDSDADSDISDIDISVNVSELSEDQRKSLDNLATLYGIADQYYCRQLNNEKKEVEYAKQLEEEEEERSKLSGRRGKRARRNLREKQKAFRTASPPSYAVRDSPTYDPYSPPHRDRTRSSSSRSPSPDDQGHIEYITEFGGGGNSPDKSKTFSSRSV
eukprot:gene17616-19370_t